MSDGLRNFFLRVQSICTGSAFKTSDTGHQFQLSIGVIDIAGTRGSPSICPLEKRAIVVPSHNHGYSNNFRHYGLVDGDRAGPEVQVLLDHLKDIGHPLDSGATFLAKVPSLHRASVIFAATFPYEGGIPVEIADAPSKEAKETLIMSLRENAAIAVRTATYSAMKTAQEHKLGHVDFAVLDGGFFLHGEKLLDQQTSARAMAEGLIAYAREGGKVSASVIQFQNDAPATQQGFTLAFNETIEAYKRTNIAFQTQRSFLAATR